MNLDRFVILLLTVLLVAGLIVFGGLVIAAIRQGPNYGP